MHYYLSYMVVDSIFRGDRPQVFRTYWIIDLNQTHSRLASCNAKNSAWSDGVLVMVCFTYCHEIVVPPHVNKYPVCDWALQGYDK